jgi:hypothetical protein
MRFLTPLLAVTLAVIWPAFDSVAAAPATATTVPAKVVTTQAAMRDLWIGHIFWVRNVVDARLGNNTSAAKAAEQQVVDNAKAIAGTIEPYYGKAASEKLFGLLAGHWGAISAYLDATRAGNKADQDAASTKLIDNAGEISTFLAGANPHLPVETLRGLLTAHGAHHIEQIKQLKAGQYEQEAATWSAMTRHMYVIADALVGGIAEQFPDKFR